MRTPVRRELFMRLHVPVIALVAIGSTAAACGGSGGGSSPLSTADDYSVTAALAELPAGLAEEDGALIRTGDLAAATELLGLNRPDQADVESVAGWLGPLTTTSGDDGRFGPLFVPLGDVFNAQRLDEIAEYDAALGWSIIDVDAFVEYSASPNLFAVVTGEFDDATLNSDLVEVSAGVVSYGDGEDREQNLEAPNPVDPLGRPLRLAQDGDRIAASYSTPMVEQWVAGADETLADDEALASVAEALDDADVVAAVLTGIKGGIDPLVGGELSPERIEATMAQVEEQIPEAPFDAVGIGWGVDDGGSAIEVVYHFTSSQNAKQAVGSFEQLYDNGTSLVTDQPISDWLTLEDVTAHGNVVAVSITLPDESRPQIIHDMLYQRDLPFISR
jgi:hypothetical protein